MNRLRLLIVSDHQNDFDKKLSTTIKKFSSERNLFLANLYNNSLNYISNSNTNLNELNNNCSNNNNNTNNKNQKNQNKSFFRGTLLKRCKSTKDVTTTSAAINRHTVHLQQSQQPQSMIITETVDENEAEKLSPNGKEDRTKSTSTLRQQSFNLDDFDRQYLFSENRKSIVKELRKNFEVLNDDGKNQASDVKCSKNKKSESLEAKEEKSINSRKSGIPVRTKPPTNPNSSSKRKSKSPIQNLFNKSSVNLNPNSDENTIKIQPQQQQLNDDFEVEKRYTLREKPSNIKPDSRTQSAKRIITRHSFYLHRNEENIYEVGDGCADCNNIKSKAKQLIEMFSRKSTLLGSNSSLSSKCKHSTSITNVAEIEYVASDRDSKENKIEMSSSTPNRGSNDLQQKLDIINKTTINRTNSNNSCNQNNHNNCNNVKNHINNSEQKCKTEMIAANDNDGGAILMGSNSNLNEIYITRNNLLKTAINHHQQQKRRSLNALAARDNNLYRNLLSDSFEDSKFGMKKSGSVNKIDLEILKSELDDYVDPLWRSNNNYDGLGYGFRSQRTLSCTKKELDLEQKIDLEIKMREGSAKLLAACNNSRNGSSNSINSHATHNTQMLEAAKNLLTSNERMTAYMAELQRRKRDKDTLAKSKPRGKVSLSEIRMPLMWRDTDHFKNKGDYRRFAVFCLAKIGTEIYDTSLLSPIDRNLTDLCFNDAILFTNISPDFELKLEVYAVMMESDLSIASTPRKIKNTIHSSISRTVGRKLAANLKDELNNTKIGPKFELIATAHLTLAEASETAHTHDLCLNPNNATVNISNKLPLFGHFCCRLAVQPDFYEQSIISGDLCIIQKEPARPIQGYARLQAFRVELWDDEKAFQASYQPRRSVDITRETKLKLRTGETDLVVTNLENGSFEEYIIRTKTAPDALKWYSAVKKSIREHNQWGHICQSEPMQLAVPCNPRNYFVRNTRQGSFYDQVPILESLDNRQSSRPNVQDIFAIPNSNGNNQNSVGNGTNTNNSASDTSPTLNDFRNRTYSSGRSSTHSSSTLSASSIGSINSRKSHWPFSGK